MAGYDVFARYYDALTANVDYAARAAYLKALLERLGHAPGLTLDLACGTGSLTLALHRLGFDVYGVDGSAAMLSEAKDKAYDQEADVLFLCQKMQRLDLYGTVDTVFCALDSINHLSGPEQVLETFKRVAFFLNDDAGSSLTSTRTSSMKRYWRTIHSFMIFGYLLRLAEYVQPAGREVWRSSSTFSSGRESCMRAAANAFRARLQCGKAHGAAAGSGGLTVSRFSAICASTRPRPTSSA
jgi:ubiquinone/menaquinone biosynthesis C-methylase UbiE